MKKSGAEKFFWQKALPVFLCIISAILCRQLDITNLFWYWFFRTLRPLLYILVYTVWAMSFSKRIIHRQTRNCLTAIAVLMIFWFVVRSCRYAIPKEWVLAKHFLWYLYYIPMLLIPAISVCLALYMRKPENYKLPKGIPFSLFLSTVPLILVILTNDWHQLAFHFLGERPWVEDNYEYGIVYYLAAGWMAVCFLTALFLILLKCRIPKTKKFIWFPFAVFGMAVVYAVGNCLRLPLWKVLFGDMTAVFCLLNAAIFESCIQSGLIPSNTGYEQLFMASTIAAQITDENHKVCFAAKEWGNKEGVRVSEAPINGGYVRWQEDISELLETLKALMETKEELRDANLIEEENLKTRKKIAQLEVKNHLYDMVQAQTAQQVQYLLQLVEQCFGMKRESEKRLLFHKITVIGAYLKRRSNLIFITAQNPAIPVKELELCFEETMRYLRAYGVLCSWRAEGEKEVAGETAMQIFDFYEKVLEKTLGGISALYCFFSVKKESVELSVNVECEADLSGCILPQGSRTEQDLDGSWVISYSVDNGTGTGGERT